MQSVMHLAVLGSGFRIMTVHKHDPIGWSRILCNYIELLMRHAFESCTPR